MEARVLSNVMSKAKTPVLKELGETKKFQMLENVGEFEKETRVMLKSNILTVRSMFEDELTLDLTLGHESGIDSEIKHKSNHNTKDGEVRRFIKDSSISMEDLKRKLDAVKKESKNCEKVLETMKVKTKDEAIRIMYEFMELIEILWNQMIALETVLIYKHQTKQLSTFESTNPFPISSSINTFSHTSKPEINDIFKGFDSFLRSRTLSYSSLINLLTKPAQNPKPDLTHSISHFSPSHSHLLSNPKSSLFEHSRCSVSLEPIAFKSGAEAYKPSLEPIKKKRSKLVLGW